ncbi:MAG TPA: hypothetical protein VJX30_07850 [Terriglobales bacterium]|nr:hypothetical protein [Candidatus Acidoferrum sp.]HKN70926.1 hypothetical protein [Terriglobales bacterium]
MKIDKIRTVAILGILAFLLPLHGQNKAPASNPKQAPKRSAAPKPEEQNVYSRPWDDGEIKSCVTYSGQPYLLVCDGSKLDWKDAFINLVGENAATGMNHEESYSRAFMYAMTHSKTFLVSFSQEAWPDPQTGIKMTMWDCSKEKTITCKFGAREK